MTFSKSNISWNGDTLIIDSITDNHIILTDNRLGNHIFVNFHDSNLYCEHHRAFDCIHIGFCLAIPAIYRALIEKGFRPGN